MTLDEIKDLKDKVYELEGLLELAQLREDKIDELEPLIKARIDALLKDDEEDSSDRIEKTENSPLSEMPLAVEKTAPAMKQGLSEKGSEPVEDFSSTQRKPAFCINDRFRFRRELFNGSDSEFAAAMNVVASMENFEEAQDYFLGELGWNPEDENVADFLEIIERYFEKA